MDRAIPGTLDTKPIVSGHLGPRSICLSRIRFLVAVLSCVDN